MGIEARLAAWNQTLLDIGEQAEKPIAHVNDLKDRVIGVKKELFEATSPGSDLASRITVAQREELDQKILDVFTKVSDRVETPSDVNIYKITDTTLSGHLLLIGEFFKKGWTDRAMASFQKLPEIDRHRIFHHLWEIKGKPSEPYDLGRIAFEGNSSEYTATAEEKMQAVYMHLSAKSIVADAAVLRDSGKANEAISLIGLFPDSFNKVYGDYELLDESLIRAILQNTDKDDIVLNKKILNLSAAKGMINIIQLFFMEGRGLSKHDQLIAMMYAAEQGHLNALQYLVAQYGGIDDEFRDLFGDFIEPVIERGHLNVLEYLISQYGETDDRFKQALREGIVAAATCGKLNIVQYLVAQYGEVDDKLQEVLEDSVDRAEHSGYIDIVQYLFLQGNWEDPRGVQLLDRMMNRAVHRGPVNIPLLQVLMTVGARMREEVRHRAIISVSSQGDAALLERLLLLGAIPRMVRDSARTQAANGAVRDLLDAVDPLPEAPAVIAAHGPAEMNSQGSIFVTFDDVREQPASYLDTIVDIGFPARVYLLDQPHTVDLGGVTKQFLTVLGEALLEKKVVVTSGKQLPMVTKEEHILNWRKMGVFFSRLYDRNLSRTDKFLAGNLFNPHFFDLVKIAGSELDNDEKIRLVASKIKEIDPDLAMIADIIIAPTDENKQEYADAMLIELSDVETAAKEDIEQYFKAAKAFYEGASEGLKDQINGADPAASAIALQGEAASAEKLSAALRIMSENPSESFLKKFEWLQEKIASSNEEWRKMFVRSITGRETLASGLKIDIKPSWRDAFEIHTCFNSIDFPTQEMTKEDFLAALDVAISGEGYNVA